MQSTREELRTKTLEFVRDYAPDFPRSNEFCMKLTQLIQTTKRLLKEEGVEGED